MYGLSACMWSTSVPEKVRRAAESNAMFGFFFTFHLPYLTTPFSDSAMQLSLEELSISREPLPQSGERTFGREEAEEPRGVMRDREERRKANVNAQRVEVLRLRRQKDEYAKKYRGAKGRIVELEHELRKVSEVHQEALAKQDQDIQAMADRLAQTEELLAQRSAELTGAQSFLSTTDGLSEAEVLGIVRDLNENVFQVAANLTEEWEKLGLSRTGRFAITQNDVDVLCRIYGPVLIQSALDRDPTGVTLLVQSCLCSIVTEIASSWGHDQELTALWSVYQRLHASSEYTSHATGETRLTYPRGASDIS